MDFKVWTGLYVDRCRALRKAQSASGVNGFAGIVRPSVPLIAETG
jgi:hypothetical protein